MNGIDTVTSKASDTFYGKIISEREVDEGYKKAKKRQIDPSAPIQSEEKSKYRSDPPNVSAFITGEKEETSAPSGAGNALINSEDFERQRSSNSKQQEGIKLRTNYAIIRCSRRKSKSDPPCKGLMFVRNGEKNHRCPKCKKKISLSSDKTVKITQSNDKTVLLEKIKK
ncbi:hypothetical protein AKJ39_04220 [candidate division MSBL1 archaeon SCGC-AAA259J03]|uniref:Uncharacterized protein n=1 Tax=candidate division MSBL1 archaeon SCGC-AAA259J03 TaxID=1698269 RepID=A0A656YV70_9EURY|nr:hypothetical protein AKJ39_04220 [candidate division MSBL1 archaeon SCGC-AAA259J03]